MLDCVGLLALTISSRGLILWSPSFSLRDAGFMIIIITASYHYFISTYSSTVLFYFFLPEKRLVSFVSPKEPVLCALSAMILRS